MSFRIHLVFTSGLVTSSEVLHGGGGLMTKAFNKGKLLEAKEEAWKEVQNNLHFRERKKKT